MENSAIEWCDHTHNAWTGCSAVSPACANCYAEAWAKRAGRNFAVRVRTTPGNWRKPLKWNAEHEAFFKIHGRRQRVFTNSLADVFDNVAEHEWRHDLFALIRETPNLDWLLLSKRIGNALHMLPSDFSPINYPNVWLGATLANREEVLRDGPKLKMLNARVLFWSVGPMLGDLGVIPPELLPDWVIAEGESGGRARPMHPMWVRRLRDQCFARGVPFNFKQWGEWTPGENAQRSSGIVATATWLNNEWALGTENLASNDGHRDDEPDLYRVGKKSAGRLLDGVLHDAFPAPTLDEHCRVTASKRAGS